MRSASAFALATYAMTGIFCAELLPAYAAASSANPTTRALQLDADVGRLRVEIERVQHAFAADAGELRAAERRAQVAQEPAVHPGDADLHRLPDAVAAREVGGPHGRGEAVGRVVRHVYGLLLLVEGRDVGAGPEDLLAHRARALGQPGPQRRLDPGAVVARVAELRHAAPGDHLRAFLLRELVVGEHLLAMLLRDQRPHAGCLVLREAEHQRLGLRLERRDEAVEYRPLD